MKKILLPLILILILCGCQRALYEKRLFAFDTEITIKVDNAHKAAADDADALCRSCEKLFSRTIASSDISRINNGEVFTPDSDTLDIIKKGLFFSRLSDGAFDITIEPLSALWNFSSAVAPPPDAAIAEALTRVGYNKIDLANLDFNGARLDLGAIAKGYIADKIITRFRETGVENAVIDLGGNVALIGREYRVGIADPNDTDKLFGVIKLKNKSAVTSGIYQRYFEYEGVRYHHILDPTTGKSAATPLASVTVISPSSVTADALSTTFMVIGEERARVILDSIPDTDALFIYKNSTYSATEGFEKKYGLER